MTTITGALLKQEFAVTTNITDLEVIIDSAVDTVNSDAGTTIAYMTGTAGSKTLTCTGGEAAALKPLIAMKLASNAVAGGTSYSRTMGILGESGSQNTGATNSNSQLYERAITNLKNASRSPPILIANEPISYE